MLSSVKGIFENGKITLEETPPGNQRMEVIVTFVNEIPRRLTKRQAGIVSGKFIMSDDFDEPLDELKEYM